jgi:hypothetical protein
MMLFDSDKEMALSLRGLEREGGELVQAIGEAYLARNLAA